MFYTWSEVHLSRGEYFSIGRDTCPHPTFFSSRAVIFKSGCFVQKYWSGTVTRNTVMRRAADYEKHTIWIELKWSLKSWKRRQNKVLCRFSEFLIQLCIKIRFFLVRAEILLLCAEKLPFLGSVQKYYYPGTRCPWSLVQDHFWGPCRNINFWRNIHL